MTSTIALLRMSKKKKKKAKTLFNQQQANRLKFVLQKKTVRPVIH